jgi:hypothetical protein
MADKTGIDDLLSILSHLLLEHQAMRVMLEADGPSWTRPAIRYCAQPHVRHQLHDKLRELADALQQSKAHEPVFALLTEVLEQSVVLQGVVPL